MEVVSPSTPPRSVAWRPISPDRPMMASVTVAPGPMREPAHTMAPDTLAPASTSQCLSEHRVGSEPRPGFHDAAVIDEQRPFEARVGVDARRRRNPRHAGPAVERRHRIASVHDVAVHLHVFLRRADVDPVVAIDRREKGLAALDERRKEASLDRPRDVRGNAIERLGLQHVDAGVDGVAGDLFGLRLFEKAQDVAGRVGLHEAVGGRVVDRRQHDGGPCPAAAMKIDEAAQIDLGQHVAVEDDDRVAHALRRRSARRRRCRAASAPRRSGS